MKTWASTPFASCGGDSRAASRTGVSGPRTATTHSSTLVGRATTGRPRGAASRSAWPVRETSSRLTAIESRLVADGAATTSAAGTGSPRAAVAPSHLQIDRSTHGPLGCLLAPDARPSVGKRCEVRQFDSLNRRTQVRLDLPEGGLPGAPRTGFEKQHARDYRKPDRPARRSTSSATPEFCSHETRSSRRRGRPPRRLPLQPVQAGEHEPAATLQAIVNLSFLRHADLLFLTTPQQSRRTGTLRKPRHQRWGCVEAWFCLKGGAFAADKGASVEHAPIPNVGLAARIPRAGPVGT